MKRKPKYTEEELLIKVLKEYYSIIDVFMKCDVNMLPEHQDKNYSI